MATVPIRDAYDNVHNVELPIAPGRSAAITSRPVVLSSEDYAALAPPRLGTAADLAFGVISAQSDPITAVMVRVIPRDANCRIAIDLDPTATATSTLLIANQEYLFSLTSGHRIAAIRDDAADGILNITALLPTP